MDENIKGRIFDIQRFSLHDGPGIRTLVFLKGCPLRCLWCANPESQEQRPELGFLKENCNKCGKCVVACQELAISVDKEGIPVIDRHRCTTCGDCTSACYPRALLIYGKEMTVKEVFVEVQKDEIYYQGSMGGVTLSGGEPLLQPVFAKELLERCRQAGIHTAIETSGFMQSEVLGNVIPVIDYGLFDLKHLHPEIHRQITGVSTDLILKNARMLVDSGVPVLFRCPLIPGINDTLENIQETASFIKRIQGEQACLELLPYHALGQPKYRALNKPYPLEQVKPPNTAQVKEIQGLYESFGVHCLVSI